MASTIKVDNVQNQPGTNIINKCSVTTTIGAGAGETVAVCAATVNLGRSGGTVNLTAGATQSGFGRTGTVDWQTGSIKTSTFTPTNGEGYFCDTSGGAFSATLPAGSAGTIVSFADYTRTFGTYALAITPNGSDKIGGVNENASLNIDGQSATFLYVDATEGWINIQETETSLFGVAPYIIASGGTTTITCGDYKTHIYTGPGSLTVCQGGSPAGSNGVEYIVVAGGGGAGNGCAAGSGGAGGMLLRTVCGSASPLNAPAPLQVSTGDSPYSITVGGAGPGAPSSPPGASSLRGGDGSNSVFSTLTTTGGGSGGAGSPGSPEGNGGATGGSGGGGGHSGGTAGAGNTPPTTPAQGFAGGASVPAGDDRGGGGGGAAATSAPPTNIGGAGSYIPTTFIGPTAPSYGETGPEGRFFAGGGGGSVRSPSASPTGGVGGLGGGADGINGPAPGSCGVINTGGGGSGGASSAPAVGGGSGGTGIVMIRYKFQ